jgi:tRNA (guanine10-N2)-dimethyltransferase
VAKLFFLLSGENETLPAAELEAILEAEGFTYTIAEKLDQLVRLEANKRSVEAVHHRSAYTMASALELFTCQAQESAVTQAAKAADFRSCLSEGENFAVRIKRVKEYSAKSDTMAFERKLGNHILQNTTGAKVDLKTPDKTFFGVLTSGKLVFGLKLTEITPKTYSERRPRKKPFFHPSAMPSKLARCMVNLARAKRSELVLDPFCGTGSGMIEAALVGCRVLGFDVHRRMAEGTRRNLKHFGVEPEGLVIADSRRLPLTRIDRVVTDPPYGKSATTMKSTTKKIVQGVLTSAFPLLGAGQLICIASPKTINIARIGVEMGYRHVESHFAYVHRTLTREIAVFQKAQGETA